MEMKDGDSLVLPVIFPPNPHIKTYCKRCTPFLGDDRTIGHISIASTTSFIIDESTILNLKGKWF